MFWRMEKTFFPGGKVRPGEQPEAAEDPEIHCCVQRGRVLPAQVLPVEQVHRPMKVIVHPEAFLAAARPLVVDDVAAPEVGDLPPRLLDPVAPVRLLKKEEVVLV